MRHIVEPSETENGISQVKRTNKTRGHHNLQLILQTVLLLLWADRVLAAVVVATTSVGVRILTQVLEVLAVRALATPARARIHEDAIALAATTLGARGGVVAAAVHRPDALVQLMTLLLILLVLCQALQFLRETAAGEILDMSGQTTEVSKEREHDRLVTTYCNILNDLVSRFEFGFTL